MNTEEALAKTVINLYDTLVTLIAELVEKGVIDDGAAKVVLDNLYKVRG